MTRRSCWRSSPEKLPVPAAARALKSSVYFAPALIAAKPVKPCDGGVFRALNSLLISERIRGKTGWIRPRPSQARTRRKTQLEPSPKPTPTQLAFGGLPIRFVCASSALCLRNESGFAGAPTVARLPQAAFSASVSHGAARRFSPSPAPETIADFAPALIAAKPAKPCDGGVFRALNLLLISERQAANQAAFRPA